MGKIAALALCGLMCLASCNRQKPQPNKYADGLNRTLPEIQGVHPEAILRFIEEAETHGIELHSFMLVRHGKVISEGWWYPYRSGIPHLMNSASKTFTATAVGFAVDEKLFSVEDKVISFFPDELPPSVSPYLNELTVKHLLTMTAGHTQAPSYNADDENWVKRFLAEPIANKPGSVFEYSTYSTYMLSAIVQQVTGQTVYDYLTPRLFEPLGIRDISWEVNKEGINTGGWGLRIKTADLAKLGMFYLQKGKWDNRQLLSESWFTEATSPQIYQQPGRTAEQNATDDWAQGYGYQLWICTNDAYRIDGAYGQFAVVMPKQDAMIAITARATDTNRELKLIWENLIPAMEEKGFPTDPAQDELLQSKLASLQLPDPFRTVDELEFPREETRSYQIAPNSMGITALTFQFAKDGSTELTLVQHDASYPFAFGQDGWKHGKTERLSPYFSSPRRTATGLPAFDVAGYAAWTGADVLQLRLLYLNDLQSETYACAFTADGITVDVTNTMDPQEAAVRLTGTKQ